MSEQALSGWSRVNLTDLASYINGYAFKPEDWSEHGLPIVRIAQITGSSADCDYYRGRLSDDLKINAGDIIFSWSGTLCVVQWNGGPAWLNQHLFKVNPADGVNSRLLYHVLCHAVAEMDKSAHGSTMKHIKRGELKRYQIFFPDCKKEQEKIGRVLDTLDTQIQKTEALIAKLEKVKEGLLHDLLTRGIDENGRLRPSPEQAPELYKASPLGLIPREWRALSVGDCLSESPQNGYSPQEAGEFTGKLMLGLGCLTQSGFLPIQLKNAPDKDPLIDRALLKDGDLLVSRANTRELVGLCGIYRAIGLPCSYPDLIMRLTPASGVSSSFMELLLRHDRVRNQIKSSASGTSGSMVKISGSTLARTSVFLPEKHEQEMILEQAFRIAERLIGERESLAKMRWFKQGLMNDLLTGRVRVTPLLEKTQQTTLA